MWTDLLASLDLKYCSSRENPLGGNNLKDTADERHRVLGYLNKKIRQIIVFPQLMLTIIGMVIRKYISINVCNDK